MKLSFLIPFFKQVLTKSFLVFYTPVGYPVPRVGPEMVEDAIKIVDEAYKRQDPGEHPGWP